MKEQIMWDLVNPEGTVQLGSLLEVKPHHETLEHKNVLLYWNSKHNGDVFLNKIGELLTNNIEGVKIVKSWEVAPETAKVSNYPGKSKEVVSKLAEKAPDFKPDIVIGSQGD